VARQANGYLRSQAQQSDKAGDQVLIPEAVEAVGRVCRAFVEHENVRKDKYASLNCRHPILSQEILAPQRHEKWIDLDNKRYEEHETVSSGAAQTTRCGRKLHKGKEELYFVVACRTAGS
jgi:hypothetical protein